jgi:hypothetical protein
MSVELAHGIVQESSPRSSTQACNSASLLNFDSLYSQAHCQCSFLQSAWNSNSGFKLLGGRNSISFAVSAYMCHWLWSYSTSIPLRTAITSTSFVIVSISVSTMTPFGRWLYFLAGWIFFCILMFYLGQLHSMQHSRQTALSLERTCRSSSSYRCLFPLVRASIPSFLLCCTRTLQFLRSIRVQ